MEATVHRIHMLMDVSLLREQVLLGAFFYDEVEHRICVQPYSIITDERVVRFLY